MTTCAILIIALSSAPFIRVAEPRRFIAAATGVVELGTCDARVYRRGVADGKPEYICLAARAGDHGAEVIFGQDRGPGGPEVPVAIRTCEGGIFRRYAAGRLATRDALTGEIRVAFDRPRPTPGYARLHYCSTGTSVYYLTTSLGPDFAPMLLIEKIPHDLLAALPHRGHADATDTVNHNDFPVIRSKLEEATARFTVGLPPTLTPATVSRCAFDIACLSDEEVYTYVLHAGTLVQYRNARDRGVIGWPGGELACKVVGLYKTDLDGPFWIVQVAPHFFVAVNVRGRVVEYTRDPGGTKSHEIARSGRNVKIVHDSGSASIISDQYNLRVTSTGITASVAAKP